VVAGVIASLALAAGSTTSASLTGRPTLHALDLQPLVVRGTAFRPFERVKLILSAEVATIRTLKASRTGTFSTRFPGVTVGRCGGFVLQALGSRGSRARLERLAPDCTEP
jgi:hypothetical protein